MKKPKKADRLAFTKGAQELIERFGAVRNASEFPLYEYSLQTRAGVLQITVYDSDVSLGWVACRFDDPKQARQFVDCNQFTGKWNHHFGSEPVADCLRSLELQFNYICRN